MDDLISRADAIEHLRSNIAYMRAFGCARAITLIKEVPSVELVRCKDCKNSEHWYGDRRRCFLWNEDGVSVFDNGFCNYGERKERDGNAYE